MYLPSLSARVYNARNEEIVPDVDDPSINNNLERLRATVPWEPKNRGRVLNI